jgi:Transposase-associated domain
MLRKLKSEHNIFIIYFSFSRANKMSSDDSGWTYKSEHNIFIIHEFAIGFRNFIVFIVASPYPYKDKIKCPCKDYANRCYLRTVVFRAHQASNGFTTSYEKWIFHGEIDNHDDNTHPSININDDDVEREVNNLAEMVSDVVGPQFDWITNEEPPNVMAKEFYEMLNDSEPLWEVINPRSVDVSKLCTVTESLNLKADYHLSQSCMNQMLSILKKALPTNNKLPKDFYRCKKMIKVLTMTYERIHVCPNSCMLFYIQNSDKIVCD